MMFVSNAVYIEFDLDVRKPVVLTILRNCSKHTKSISLACMVLSNPSSIVATM